MSEPTILRFEIHRTQNTDMPRLHIVYSDGVIAYCDIDFTQPTPFVAQTREALNDYIALKVEAAVDSCWLYATNLRKQLAEAKGKVERVN